MISVLSNERLRVLSSLSQLSSVEAALARLADECKASVFTHPSFFLPFAEEAIKNGQIPHCLAMMRDEELVAFLPLFSRRDRKALFARRLGPPRFGASPAFDLLIKPGMDVNAVLDAFAEATIATRWMDLGFRDEPSDTRVATDWIRRFERPQFIVARSPSYAYCVLKGFENSDAYVAAMRSHNRKVFKRWESRFLEMGEITCHTSADDIAFVSECLHEVIRKSWKEGPFMEHRLFPFIRVLMGRMMPLGLMRVWLARTGGRTVAAVIEFDDANNHRHGYFTAIAEDAKQLNVGMTLHYVACKAAIDDKIDHYELWGYRDYLKKLGNNVRQTENISIRRRGVTPGLQLCALSLLSKSRNAFRKPKRRQGPAQPAADAGLP